MRRLKKGLCLLLILALSVLFVVGCSGEENGGQDLPESEESVEGSAPEASSGESVDEGGTPELQETP